MSSHLRLNFECAIDSLLPRFVLVVSVLLGSHTICADTGREILRLANGEQLRGQVENEIAVFRGIPFAQPPMDDLR